MARTTSSAPVSIVAARRAERADQSRTRPSRDRGGRDPEELRDLPARQEDRPVPDRGRPGLVRIPALERPTISGVHGEKLAAGGRRANDANESNRGTGHPPAYGVGASRLLKNGCGCRVRHFASRVRSAHVSFGPHRSLADAGKAPATLRVTAALVTPSHTLFQQPARRPRPCRAPSARGTPAEG